MSEDELVTHEQVMRWLPRDIRAALNPHKHRWVTLSELSKPYNTEICTAPYCDEERRIDL